MNKGKLLSWVITFTLVLSSFAAVPMMTYASDATTGNWTEKAEYLVQFTGAGTESDPFLISEPGNLAYLADQVNSGTSYAGIYFKQTADLDLDAHFWVPIGDEEHPFAGTFNGGQEGIEINNLKIDSGADYQGLFGYVASPSFLDSMKITNADVQGGMNVGTLAGACYGRVDNCTAQGVLITGSQNVGGLIGKAQEEEGTDCSITNCKATEVKVSGDNATGGLIGFAKSCEVKYCMADAKVNGGVYNAAGGLIGSATGTVEQCYSLGAVSGSAEEMGGLIGLVEATDDVTSILDCYSWAEVIGELEDSVQNLGGLIGKAKYVHIKNCYSAGEVQSDEGDNSGGLIGLIDDNDEDQFKPISCYYDLETTGQADTEKGDPKSTLKMKTMDTFADWDFTNVWRIVEHETYPTFNLQEGGGEEEGDCIIPGCDALVSEGAITHSMVIDGETYYCIENRKQLEHIASHMDENFVQTQDIDLSGDPWTPIGGFEDGGTFYGQYITTNSAIIKNMTFDYSGVGELYAGLFAILSEGAHVDGVKLIINDIDLTVDYGEGENEVDSYGRDLYFGGIAGLHESPQAIINCAVTIGAVQIENELGDVYFGGITGCNNGSLENCDVYTVSEEPFIISSPANSFVGGIAGYTYGYMFDCDHNGDIVLKPVEGLDVQRVCLGGIAGYADSWGYWDFATIEYCQNDGDVVNKLSTVTDSETRNGYINGAYVGGIVGYLDADEVYNTFSATEVDDNEYAGAVVRNCANIGEDNTVSAEAASAMAGGIAGASRFIPEVCPYIINCYNRSEILSTRTTPASIDLIEVKEAKQDCEGAASGGIIGASGGIIIETSYSSTPTVSAVEIYHTPLIGIVPIEGEEKTYEGGVAGLVWDSQFLQNYYEKKDTVQKGIGASVAAIDLINEDIADTENYLGVTVAQLKDRNFFGSEWCWYPGGGILPHYYYLNEVEDGYVLHQWRYIAADTYPVLRGLYTPPVVTQDGGSHGGGGGSNTVVTTSPPALNKIDHFAYVVGYPDGTVKPMGTITREEVAVIFYRLMTAESRKAYYSTKQPFTDVSSDRWSNDEIATLYNAKIITGNADGSFKPAEPISRAEFAAIAAKFDKLEKTQDNKFSDISTHWAKDYINSSAVKGWIGGYEDGTFRPDTNILRCEAMKLINEVLDRRVDAAGLLTDARQWTDNTPDKWYYDIVLESTNTHDYERANTPKSIEKWTKIKTDPVW